MLTKALVVVLITGLLMGGWMMEKAAGIGTAGTGTTAKRAAVKVPSIKKRDAVEPEGPVFHWKK